MTGVYQIRCKANGRRYVGSSLDIKRRWKEHRSDLRKRRHCNARLQNAWNKYGERAFEFKLIQLTSVAELIPAEKLWFWLLQPEMNIQTDIGRPPMLGKTHTEETRAKLRAWAHSPEGRLACSGGKGVAQSLEHKRNMGRALKKAWERRRRNSAALA